MSPIQSLLVLISFVGVPCLAQHLAYVEGTRGGNSPGRACSFPFIYKGLEYDYCITNDNKFVPWCSTTPNYDTMKQWTKCEMALMAARSRRGNAGRSSCSLPFTYKGKTYENCTTTGYYTNKPWCSTSPDFTRDKRWAECVRFSDIKTNGGRVPAGTPCSFPYKYRGYLFTGCITANNQGIPWCSTSPDYDRDKQWGNCEVTTLKSSSSDGGCENTYTMERGTLSYGGADAGSSVDTVDKCKIECNKEGRCIGFDYDNNPGVPSRCFLHTNQRVFDDKERNVRDVDQYTVTRCADGGGQNRNSGEEPETETGKPVTTKGGNAGPRGRCSFPFTFRGFKYGSCTSTAWFTPWCGTTPNYDNDQMWGECNNIPTK